MASAQRIFLFQLLWFAILLKGVLSTKSEDIPDFFKITAKQMTDAIGKQMMDTFGKAKRSQPRADQQDEEDPRQPELHFSTLRVAQASGSGIPSPTMFIGGFSFMMMPTPEGSEVFNRIMDTIPNFNSGGK